MDIAIVALAASGVTTLIQIYKFFEDKIDKKDSAFKMFSKATDVKTELDEIRVNGTASTKYFTELTDEHGDRLQKVEREQAVIVERVDNEIKLLTRLDQKLDEMRREMR